MASIILSSLFFLLITSFLPTKLSSSSLYPTQALPTKSGYLPVTLTSSAPISSSLYYAFYEAQQPISSLASTPLLLWLQGGPGCSSMVGNLFELGPWLLFSNSSSLSLYPNPFSWNRRFGLLFIDNPIGSGFSVAKNSSDIPRDQSTVASHLWAALQSFLTSDASFRSRPFYVSGESYAGKYVPSISYYILKQNAIVPRKLRINLKGAAIGNGLTHPVVQVATHADSAYFTGLINAKQKLYMESLQDEAVKLTVSEKWEEASDARGTVLDWLQNVTGLATLYDMTKTKPYQTEVLSVFLNKQEVQEALGVQEKINWEECSDQVAEVFHADIMKSTKYMVEELLRKTRVLLYQGIYDLRDGVVSTEAWMKQINWDGLEGFLEAERKVWKVDRELFGYVQRYLNLSHVVISGAGHLVPADKGRSAQTMIEDWVMQKGLFAASEENAAQTRRFY
ncbi:Carboxypeptidase [Rhynchospora pubera]|uniref:Carboxypeptidase n=1 Tax=Rhynchospora pubera TaxID=906938 RepID=A0AAV8ERQ0_9POAL|nr:Carboxypeptidase [Rhynchospora pubera]KAJ4780782.1 Carboxypeptidase [Rhynchospora pubera]